MRLHKNYPPLLTFISVFLGLFISKVCRKFSYYYWRLYALQYLRWRGAKYPNWRHVVFNGRTILEILPGANIEFEDRVISNSGVNYAVDNYLYSKLHVESGATFKVGDDSGWTNTVIQCHDSITIGSHVNIGAGCMIFDTNFHSTDWRDRADRSVDCSRAKTAPIVIGDYAFIGARSIICKGVTIGPRAMIAAGSVVVKDVPADCIAGGNPCKIIDKR